MTDDWRHYEEFEEEFNKVDIKSPKTKKKKTWKQINEEKQRQVTKKQWQKKRRVSKKVGKDDGR
jgi:phosphatidylserine/phosphatidylglycerophosphate/cardiolipin synthase-like enzyme